MGDKAEVVVDGDEVRHKRIVIEGQVGPSAPSGKIAVRVMLNGLLVAVASVRNPDARITLNCNSPELNRRLNKRQNVFTLIVEGGGKQIPGDPRVLDFRVFDIRMDDISTPLN
jgi:hypothetical protein